MGRTHLAGVCHPGNRELPSVTLSLPSTHAPEELRRKLICGALPVTNCKKNSWPTALHNMARCATSRESVQGLVSRVTPIQTALRNCTGDEGRPFGFGDQVADPKPPRAAAVKCRGG